MIAILIKLFIGNINGYKNIKKIIWLCMLIPVFGIAKEKPTVVYTPLELLEMTVTNKIPNSETPVLDKFDSSKMLFNECKSIAKIVISNFSNAYPTVIDVDSSTHFKVRVGSIDEVFTLECVNDEKRVYRAKYKPKSN
ncbi:hypothetical protein RHA65_12410 [Providencia rettgeri]|uniref:hypothetical protein n=1 Tax=Providencia TaxID=586 RepID=UPI001B361DCD|nr:MULTISPECIES: hypothetical protein [Providencia]EIL1984821.1 hypothetical protein [Providencia rettgeri]EIL1985347.1 hypothetical protein [Providencia rettgeri]EIU9516486.1 hypothetical protein [Providencia rettgeri]EIU9517668.1 hypothetical protein [Providencia rettgeri]ELR5097287.1 hypothetical protein [Providencia rettgeri]